MSRAVRRELNKALRELRDGATDTVEGFGICANIVVEGCAQRLLHSLIREWPDSKTPRERYYPVEGTSVRYLGTANK